MCTKRDITPIGKRFSLPFSVAKLVVLATSFFISNILLMEIETRTTKQQAISIAASFSDNAPKTAIVYLTKALDECRAIRLGHLLQTVPPNMDVWLLHNHNLTNNETILTTSMNHVRRLQRKHLLYSESQANEQIQKFDTKRSGAAKSSFLRWIVEHPEYKHAWHMEDDILFTGEWSHFFAHADNKADFVGPQFKPNDSWIHFKNDQCTMDQNYIRSSSNKRSNSTVNGRIMCRKVLTLRSLWSIVRISTRLAQLLLNDLESGTIEGHHEAVLQGALMAHANLTFMELPPLVGRNTAGGWGRYVDRTICSLDIYQPINDNQLYHPVKCEAYTGEKLDNFKEIMMTYGWSNGTMQVPDVQR
jgi:hypothetical protein